MVAGSGEAQSLFEALRSQLLHCFVQLLTVLFQIPKAFKAELVNVKLRAEALRIEVLKVFVVNKQYCACVLTVATGRGLERPVLIVHRLRWVFISGGNSFSSRLYVVFDSRCITNASFTMILFVVLIYHGKWFFTAIFDHVSP